MLRSALVLGLLLALPAGDAHAQRRFGVGKPPQPVQRTVHPSIQPSETSLVFGAVAEGEPATLSFDLVNSGAGGGALSQLTIELGGAGNGLAWTVEVGGSVYPGGAGTVVHSCPQLLGPGQSLPILVTFTPTEEQYDALVLRLRGQFDEETSEDELAITLSGLGGHEGDPYLHVVASAPEFVVDYDDDGVEPVLLDGTGSHTHEPGRSLVSWEWSQDQVVFSTDPALVHDLPLGSNEITLAIADDGMPQRALSGSTTVDVLGADAIPGALALYYDAAGVGASALLDAVPANPDFGEVRQGLSVPAGSTLGSSEFTLDVLAVLRADLEITAAGDWEFLLDGGVGTRLLLDGAPLAGPIALTPGTYALEARFAVDDVLEDLPLSVTATLDGGTAPAPELTHDESTLPPILNSMPTLGIDAGGNLITIDGMGFFPADQVTLHWGSTDFTAGDFSVLTPTRIELDSPAGQGTIGVQVETPQGTSNLRHYQYSPSGPVPVKFVLALAPEVDEPTAAVWGPDRRLYVVTNDGHLVALAFDDTYSSVVSQITYPGVSGLTNPDALGVTVNPFDPPSPVRLYVGHGEHFLNGGSTFSGPSPYTGQVSVLEGPAFDTPVPLITGLPTSNHDHAVNGLQFDHNGDLFVAVGSNTNAGVRHPNSGDLPESPLSAAVLRARTSDPAFDGAVTYVETISQVPNDDQVDGEIVDVAPGVDVEVFAHGLRNPFGLLYTTKKRLYCTDNGPNVGFGAASTGPLSESPDPYDDDEIDLLEHGLYYGSPNRSRGRTDPRQNVYRGSLNGPPSIPGEFRQQVSWVPPATCGVDEYRANTFQGQMRGWLVCQEYLDSMRRVRLSDDGRKSLAHVLITPWTGALGVTALPGGALAALNHNQDLVQVLRPDDLAAVGLVVHDVFPWRAPATGGYPFTIAGTGFGNLADTTVTIGGLPATLTRVSATRIEGLVPENPAPTKDLVDVVVAVDEEEATLPDAFRFLFPVGTETGDWESLPQTPTNLGEVAAGEIDGLLFVVGEPASPTYCFDLMTRTWKPSRAARPYVGHHHAAEVVDGLLYLIGGLGGGSEGKVQIYDPQTNTWSLGTAMPWAAGSVSTGVIDGRIYAAGGIVSTFTVGNCAVYDPALDTWTALAPMPDGRNHAAAASDGERLWIFGGRKGGNFVTNGFGTTFVYDPVLDAWESSDDLGSSLQPLPQARGGTGKAVLHQGELYVFGGETFDGPGATPERVYDRVDVYDPVANAWRLDQPMPSPRHGIFPVLFESRILLPGGGTQAGFSQSRIFDVFSRQ